MKKRKNTRNRYPSVAVLYTLILVSGIFSGILLIRLLYLLYFLTTIYFMPGSILIHRTGLKWKDPTEKVFFSFAAGWSLNVLLYFILLILKLQQYSSMTALVYSVFMIGWYWRKKEEADQCAAAGKQSHFLVFYAGLWILAFFTYQMANRDASVTGSMEWVCQDNVYWIRNTVAAVRGYPLENMSTLGTHVYTHFFSNLQLAFLHQITGIEITELSFSLSYVWNLFLFTGGVYCLFRELLKKSRWIDLGMLCTCFASGTLPAWTHLIYPYHVLICSFGFLEGYALSFYAFTGALLCIRQKVRSWRMMLLLFAAALGSKAPAGCLVLVGTGWLCVDLTVSKRRVRDAVIIAGSYLIVFAVICSVVFYQPQNVYTNGIQPRSGFSLTRTVTQWNGFYLRYQDQLSPILCSRRLSAGILAVIFLWMSNFLMNYYISVSLAAKLVHWFRSCPDKAVFAVEETAVYLIVLTAYLVFIVFWQEGYSQSYFIYIAFPYGLAAAFMHFDNGQGILRYRNMFAYTGLILTGISLAVTLQTLTPYIEKGVYNLSVAHDMDQKQNDPAGNSLIQGEQEALRWIRAHTDPDAVFITNKILCEAEGKYSFVSSAYTERRMYLEGYAYGSIHQKELEKRLYRITSYYTGDIFSSQRLKDSGIDYAIVFMNVPGYTDFADGTVIYDNEYVKVVHLDGA